MPLMNARMVVVVLSLLSVLLAGCNNEPDPEFGQKREQQMAARAGDPYATLGDTVRPYRYLQVDKDQRQARAVGYAQSLRSSYTMLLRKLDEEAVPADLKRVAAACKAAYAKASMQPPTAPSGLDEDHTPATLAALIQCRMQVQAVSGNEHGQVYAGLLKRFASTGVVLVGMTTVVAGDAQVGLDIWRKGDAWVQEDKPGFELSLDAFR